MLERHVDARSAHCFICYAFHGCASRRVLQARKRGEGHWRTDAGLDVLESPLDVAALSMKSTTDRIDCAFEELRHVIRAQALGAFAAIEGIEVAGKLGRPSGV